MNYRIVLSVLLAISLLSCDRQDDHDKESCPNFKNFRCDFGPFWQTVNPTYEFPCFNPNNPDEFVYVSREAVWKHILSTGESERIYDNVTPIKQLTWGESGWIAFGEADWDIWTVREDGSELSNLSNTENRAEFSPEISPEGDRVVYSRVTEYSDSAFEADPSLRRESQIIVSSLAGTAIDSFCRLFNDSICSTWEVCSWSFDDRLAAEYRPNSERYGLAIYDFDGNVTSVVYQRESPSNGKATLRDIQWHPSLNQIFFTNGFGLQRANLDDGTIDNLISGCDTRNYWDISISADGNKILATERNSEFANCRITHTLGLVIMDIDGNNRQVIELP